MIYHVGYNVYIIYLYICLCVNVAIQKCCWGDQLHTRHEYYVNSQLSCILKVTNDLIIIQTNTSKRLKKLLNVVGLVKTMYLLLSAALYYYNMYSASASIFRDLKQVTFFFLFVRKLYYLKLLPGKPL